MSSTEDQNMDMSDVKSALNQTLGLDESGSADNSSPKRNTEKKMIDVSYKNVKYSWETNGDESISDWVMRNMLEIGFKPPSDKNKLIFRKSVSGAIINIGWDASILKEEENYKCEFCSTKNAKQSMCRNDFPDSIDFSEVKSFKIKNKGSTISLLHRFQDIEFLQVNFLPGESLYEALYRDGRFDNTILQNYNLQLPKEDDKTVLLSISANNYAGHDFKFSKQRPQPNAKLEVKPYKGNQQTGKPADSIEVKTEPSENQVKAETSGVLVKEEASEERESSSGTTISSDRELLNFIKESMLELKINENEKKVVKELDTLFNSSYDNYALKENRQLYTADHEVIVNVCKSVGAVVVKYTSGKEAFKGTCFRIGAKFVLTNCHVFELILKELQLVECILIDFDHGEPDPPSHRVFPLPTKPVIVFDEVLDYAVLSLDVQDGQELPPSLLTGLGMLGLPRYSTNLEEGRMLTFVGHPGGGKTATNVCCPVRNPGNLAKEYAITLSQQEWLTKDNMETYDVSTFFDGSSGSPGFLVKERMLIVMHTRRRCLNWQSGRSVEQGVMISAIVSDIMHRINAGSLLNFTFQDLFGVEKPQ